MKITTLAKTIAERTMDAYSADRYSSWVAVVQVLLDRGYNEAQTEEIVRSKWTRWAADQSTARYGRVSSTAMTKWLDKSFSDRGKEHLEVIAMMEGR